MDEKLGLPILEHDTHLKALRSIIQRYDKGNSSTGKLANACYNGMSMLGGLPEHADGNESMINNLFVCVRENVRNYLYSSCESKSIHYKYFIIVTVIPIKFNNNDHIEG